MILRASLCPQFIHLDYNTHDKEMKWPRRAALLSVENTERWPAHGYVDRTNAPPTSHRGQAPETLIYIAQAPSGPPWLLSLVILISLTLFVIDLLFVFLTPLSLSAECRIYTEVVSALIWHRKTPRSPKGSADVSLFQLCVGAGEPDFLYFFIGPCSFLRQSVSDTKVIILSHLAVVKW